MQVLTQNYQISIPQDWTPSQFNFNDRVSLGDHVTLDKVTGCVVGMEYIRLGDYPPEEQVRPGWWYSIRIDKHHQLATTDPVHLVHESKLHAVEG